MTSYLLRIPQKTSFEVNDQPSLCMEGIWPTPHFHCSNVTLGQFMFLQNMYIYFFKKKTFNRGKKKTQYLII